MRNLNQAAAFAPLSDSETLQVAGNVPSYAAAKENEWEVILPIRDTACLPPDTHPVHGRYSQRWVYTDADGADLFYVCRFDVAEGKKVVLPLTYCRNTLGHEEWRWHGVSTPRPLYNLSELAKRPDVPVLVCEGEKSAEAAATLFPGYVTITSPNGSKAANRADWKPLAGRAVTIWPDHDDPGRKYAEAVSALAWAAGAASVAVVQVPEYFPDKWDLADALPGGSDGQDLQELLANAMAAAKPVKNSAGIHPKGFRMLPTGLYFDSEKDENAIWISSYFEVLAETRKRDKTGWGLLLQWLDRDDHPHTLTIPQTMLVGDPANLQKLLLDNGLKLSALPKGRNLLNMYLSSVSPGAMAVCVDRTGWEDKVYVTSSRVYGDTKGETVVFQSEARVPDYTVRGTLSEWQDNIAKLAVGNSRLGLAISAAFAGPLLHLIGEENFGFHFAGGSSSGKTTALRCAGSVWGIETGSWRTTDNAAETMACAANDGLLLLDELSQADGHAADAMVYMLGNGQGKHRLRKDITSKPALSWRVVFLSSGEIGIATKINEADQTFRAGHSVRLIEISADAGKGYKLFDTLHDFRSGNDLANHLRHACETYRGTVLPPFLDAVTADVDATTRWVRDRVEAWKAAYIPSGVNGQVSRVGARFALTAAAGAFATYRGLLPWPEGEAFQACAACFNDWLATRGTSGSAEDEAALQQVRAFIETYGLSRFIPIYSDSTPLDGGMPVLRRAGYRRRDEYGRWCYMVLATVWTNEVCKGLNPRAVAKALIAKGLMKGDANGRSSCPVCIPGEDKMRVYYLLPDILVSEAGSSMPDDPVSTCSGVPAGYPVDIP